MKKTILSVVLAASAVFQGYSEDNVADYRYAPQWHCSTPAFPDDSCKTLVGPEGMLMYGYGGPFFPYTQNLGFDTVISVYVDEDGGVFVLMSYDINGLARDLQSQVDSYVRNESAAFAEFKADEALRALMAEEG